tara:strand:+ start:41 stop:328 length:288 start_codon:yes stop_codon:yes gene_type:complete
MRERRQRRNKGGRQSITLTPEERLRWARERRELVGKVLLQEGWEGALVVEHVRGSQYVVKLSNGEEIFASHKKQKNETGDAAFTKAGWRKWEERR